MKKLLDLYRNLPPELRVLVAMLGVGTPLGVVYALQYYLKIPYLVGVLVLVGIVLVISILTWLISRAFSFKKTKRTRKLAQDLASTDAAGPVSMDVRAAIQDNNKKFAAAVHRMRKEFRINTYDLPWYIVIGDSGCGKTKLVNEAGLVLGAGKPEGYQLGTLNYNFWLSEDAVFIDMAGRLCNPQDDADHREWQAFLSTIARGRRGYPINGALVCVSAEHLLADPPEKHEVDANTALERLRELQQTLGVTFATYLCVTKCDKILGFMQLFDRADRDIMVKNQIFGWSKPGDFDELYNPEGFEGDFTELYGRLSDLRLRRLNDDADEHELGAAYTFPEEFRELKDPLRTYVRVLFPFIKNPKAIKNLVFRGVYFTSATQQGGLILKHLQERLGQDATTHFAPLESLYPRPRPHFIKDLLFRKVFPEQGLVFRNEQQVLRNRRLAKWLAYGSAALAVVMIATLWWSFTTFNKVIAKALVAVNAAKTKHTIADEALGHTATLASHVTTLDGEKRAAWILSLGLGADGPIRDLKTVQFGLFEKGVMPEAIKKIQEVLKTTNLSDGKDTSLRVEQYEMLLRGYLAWLASAKQGQDADVTVPALLAKRDKKDLCGFLKSTKKDGDSLFCKAVLAGDAELPRYFSDFAEDYFSKGSYDLLQPEGKEKSVHRRASLVHPDPTNPTIASPKDDTGPAQDVAIAAIGKLGKYYEQYAKIDKNHPDPTIREWVRLSMACKDVDTNYTAIIEPVKPEKGNGAATSAASISTVSDFDKHKEELKEKINVLTIALGKCSWGWKAEDSVKDKKAQPTGKGSQPLPYSALPEAVKTQRQKWNAAITQLEKAYTNGAPTSPEDQVSQAIQQLRTGVASPATGGAAQGSKTASGSPGAGKGLDDLLCESLNACGFWKDDAECKAENLDKPEACIAELDVKYGHIVELNGTDGGTGDVQLEQHANTVKKAIEELCGALGNCAPSDKEEHTPEEWSRELCKQLALVNGDKDDCDEEAENPPPKGLQTSAAKAAKAAGKPAVPPTTEPADPLDSLAKEWRSDVLRKFLENEKKLIERAKLTYLLLALEKQLETAANADWGVATMWNGEYQQAEPSNYFLMCPPPDAGRENEGARRKESARTKRPRRTRSRANNAAQPQPAPRPQPTGDGQCYVYRCATRDFLKVAFDAVYELRLELGRIEPKHCLTQGNGEPKPTQLYTTCTKQLKTSADKYLTHYFNTWKETYEKSSLNDLNAFKNAEDWGTYQEVMKGESTDGKVKKRLEGLLNDLLEHVVWAEYDWCPKDKEPDDWKQDRELLKEQRKTAWSNLPAASDFNGADLGNNTYPWNVVARDVCNNWSKFAKDLGYYPKLPNTFLDSNGSGNAPYKEINWNPLGEQYAKGVEKLDKVAAFVEVAEYGKELLDCEIQKILIAHQKTILNPEEKLSTVPFGSVDSKPITITVDADNFAQYLKDIKNAKERLSPLEKGLGEQAGGKARETLYKGCNEWRTLLIQQAKPEEDGWKELDVSVTYEADYAGNGQVNWKDAVVLPNESNVASGPPQGGPNNFYSVVHLCLGLRAKATPANVAEADCLSFETQQNSPTKSYVWKWKAGGKPPKVRLAGVSNYAGQGEEKITYDPVESDDLCKGGPLSFLELLYRWGAPRDDEKRKDWQIPLQWNLPGIYKQRELLQSRNTLDQQVKDPKDKIVGTKFRFTFETAVPKPITLLKKIPMPTKGEGTTEPPGGNKKGKPDKERRKGLTSAD